MQRLVSASLMLLLAGPVTAQQSAPHHQRFRRPVQADAQSEKKNVTVSGSVTGADGKSAAHASVYLSWFTQANEVAFHRVETATDGTYKMTIAVPISAQNYGYMITALLPGKGMAWLEVPESEISSPHDLKLKPGATLTGKLVRLDGTAAANVPLRVDYLSLQARTMEDMSRHVTRIGSQGTLLPPEEITRLFNTTTDAQGRFTLTGLPRTGQISLALKNDLILTPGSSSPITLTKETAQSVGILAAAQTGSLTGTVTDKSTGDPLCSQTVYVSWHPDATRGFSGANPQNTQAAQTDENGAWRLANLIPGYYTVSCRGYMQSVQIGEGQAGKPVALVVRQGPLTGRVLDADGKPVVRIPIHVRLSLTGEASSQRIFRQAGFNRGQINGDIDIVSGGAANDTNIGTILTDAQGRFVIPDFAWSSPQVTLVVERENDVAEWSGSPDSLKTKLEMRLKPAARITVRGRLIDPQRRPITQVTFQTLHWQPTPRSTWFATAHTVMADAQGRFCVTGLERGESFSMITASNDGRGMGGAKFESPRFETSVTRREQELGDVMVHPLDEQDDIGQIYGFGTTRELAGMMNFLPVPNAADTAAAQQAYAQYQAAMQAGDVDALHRLTSNFSSGWSEPRTNFLLSSCLRSAANAVPTEKTRAIRYVTQIAAAAVISASNLAANVNGFGFDLSGAGKQIGDGKDWVFLGTLSGERLKFVRVLHREAGAWRVVNVPTSSEMFNLDSTILAGSDSTPVHLTENALANPVPLPAADDLAAAHKTAENYLTAWSHEQTPAMFALTSDNSTDHARTVKAYQKRMAGRLDEGFCPLNPDDAIALNPAGDLTKFDLLQLANIAIARDDLSGNRRMAAQNANFPIRDIERGNLIAFRYTAQDRTFLMLLKRSEGKWSVVEPALPL